MAGRDFREEQDPARCGERRLKQEAKGERFDPPRADGHCELASHGVRLAVGDGVRLGLDALHALHGGKKKAGT